MGMPPFYSSGSIPDPNVASRNEQPIILPKVQRLNTKRSLNPIPLPCFAFEHFQPSIQ